MTEGAPVVVVGSGPAGAAACHFLSRAGVKVLLLEAGSKDSARGFTLRLGGMTVARRRRTLRQRPRVTMTGDPQTEFYEELAPGGLSNHWSCAVPRFSPEDFADAERAGEAHRWPVGYADLAPFYDQVEPLLHIAGATQDFEQLPAGKVRHARRLAASWAPLLGLAREQGRTLTPMPYAYGGDTTLTPSPNAFNAHVRLIKPALAAGRLTARYGVRVVRLEWSASTRRVEALIVRDNRGGSEERIPCRAVVLGAGAIASAEILLDSLHADFPQGIGNGSGNVGRYLHDHPLGKIVIDLERPFSIHPPAYLTRQAQARSRPLLAAACMQWSGAAMVARGALRGHPTKLDWVGFSVFGTMVPTHDDHVELDPSGARVDGASALRLHVHHPAEAIAALEQARDQLIELFSKAGSGPRQRVWKVEPAGNSNHYGGTCRMHASPRFGVVDAFSRLHEARNVMVADSGVFTTGPEKNPVLTAMTLAARGSDRLANEIKSGDL